MKKNMFIVAICTLGVVAGASVSARKWFADTRAKVSNVFGRRKSPSTNLRELGKRPEMGSNLGKKLFKNYSDVYQQGRQHAVDMAKYKKQKKQGKFAKLTPQEKVKARIKYEQIMHWDPVKGNWRHKL